MLLRLPTAPTLPPGEKGDFGTSPIYEQLSNKPALATLYMEVRNIKNNRDEKLKAKQNSKLNYSSYPPSFSE
jgi:hypothetical protein